MLDFEDDRWNSLTGGYKNRYDPRVWLQNLQVGKDTDASWKELWNQLHHQGDVGSASYAAVPWLAHFGKDKSFRNQDFYGLLSTIEMERHRKENPSLPGWLEKD